mmetsp:Transcript_25252/g.75024  ORF Transcript_25252/g.75024 Transcript_25252/m.75024 type:complete len:265 (+) Transcript_25252:3396-4190(+)
MPVSAGAIVASHGLAGSLIISSSIARACRRISAFRAAEYSFGQMMWPALSIVITWNVISTRGMLFRSLGSTSSTWTGEQTMDMCSGTPPRRCAAVESRARAQPAPRAGRSGACASLRFLFGRRAFSAAVNGCSRSYALVSEPQMPSAGSQLLCAASQPAHLISYSTLPESVTRLPTTVSTSYAPSASVATSGAGRVGSWLRKSKRRSRDDALPTVYLYSFTEDWGLSWLVGMSLPVAGSRLRPGQSASTIGDINSSNASTGSFC